MKIILIIIYSPWSSKPVWVVFVLNIKYDILENVGNQTTAGPRCENNNKKLLNSVGTINFWDELVLYLKEFVKRYSQQNSTNFEIRAWADVSYQRPSHNQTVLNNLWYIGEIYTLLQYILQNIFNRDRLHSKHTFSLFFNLSTYSVHYY